MVKYKIFSLIFLITSLIVLFLLFMNSRLYLNKYIFEPLNSDQIEDNILNDLSKLKDDLKFRTGVNDLWYKNDFVNISQLLHSGVSRYMQNNKSYLYIYSENKKLNKKEFKKLKSIVKNISLEGAYFLHPKNLDKVMINFKYIDEKDTEILLKYFEFIMKQEIDKIKKKNIRFTLSKELKNEISDKKQLLKYYGDNITKVRELMLDKIKEQKETEMVRKFFYTQFDERDYADVLNNLFEINKFLWKKIRLDKKNLSIQDMENLEKWLKNSDDIKSINDSIQSITSRYSFLTNLEEIILFIQLFEKLKNIEIDKKETNILDLSILANIEYGLAEIISGLKVKPIYGFNINKENVEKLVKDINSVHKILKQTNSLFIESLSMSISLNYRSDELFQAINTKIKYDEFINAVNKKTSLERKDSFDSIRFAEEYVDIKKLTKTYLSNIKFVKKSVNTIEIFSSLLFSFVMSIVFTYLILNFGYKKNL